MQEVKKEKKKKQRSPAKLLLVAVTFVFLAYSAFTIVSQSIQVSQKKAELEELTRQLQIQEIKNDDIKEVQNYTDEESKEYMEQIARQDLDYIKQGERVFVNIAGD